MTEINLCNEVLENAIGVHRSLEKIKPLNPIDAVAVQAMEELLKCRAIGTVEDFKRAKAMENVYGQVKWERDVAISQLEEIGISLGQKMDEFKVLKEKNEPKKIVINNIPKTSWTKATTKYTCPYCDRVIDFNATNYCSCCGQKLDWSE